MKQSILLLVLFLCSAVAQGQGTRKFDLVIYGGTASGVFTAVAAAREGLRVAVLEPGRHLGGMVTSGLSATDHGKKDTIGGYTLEFYKRLGQRYGKDIEWYPEPHVAEEVLEDLIRGARVAVFYQHRLRENGGVRKVRSDILEIRAENGAAFKGKVFVDASYEGDLMAQAGVSYTWGREGVSQYDESLAGVRPMDRNNQFEFPVAAYAENHKLLPEIQKDPPGKIGCGDRKVQAYNFRLVLTTDPLNRVSFPKPFDYDPKRFELLLRFIAAFRVNTGKPPTVYDIFLPKRIAGGKWDFNNHGHWFSSDYIGKSWDYPNATYTRRDEIWKDHINYIKGLLYFLTHDERVPNTLRDELKNFGLARDEFTDNENWPYQLYIREARRMVGDFVMTQKDIQTEVSKRDVIGMGSYNSDSHNVQRYVNEEGNVQYEGSIDVRVTPYQVPYRLLLPQRREATNLLVSVCFSASHVAYSTLRMEPVYMIIGQAAGVAASMAIERKSPVQDVDTTELTAKLRAQGVIMERSGPPLSPK
jgi:hypothetical protein